MAQRNTFRDDEDLEEKINMRDLARVGVYLKPYMARVVWILIVVAAMGCINVVEPYLTKIMIDSVIPAKNLALLGELVALLAVLIVIYEFGLRYRTVEITRVGQLMLKDMRRDLFTHIQTLPFSYFDSRPHGKILIRVVNYVNTLSDTLSSGLVNVISDVFTFFITLVVMFVVDWRLALYSLALFPLLIAWVLGLQHFQRRAYQVLSNKQSNLNAFIHESIAGVKTTQTFARVLLADPRILILDEATSNIDTRTEEALQAGLNHLLKGRTSFIIAHRLSTIENADEICYIDHGQIVEQGNHAELLARHGAYYRLYESQYAMIKV